MHTFQMMSVDDFTTMLHYLVQVAWCAAAGQLQLVSTMDGKGIDGAMLVGSPSTASREVSIKVSTF